MEFWGVELKGDKPVKVEPAVDEVVHLSQATLADLKKGSEPVMLYAKVGNQKLVIGVLSAEKYPQLPFDLVFEKEFELSHNSKNGSVHLTGYKSIIPDDSTEEEVYSDSSDEEEAVPIEEKQNGVVAAPASTKAKPAAPAAKKDNKPKEESDEDDDSDSDDEDDESDESDTSDEVVAGAEEDDDSDEDESDEEETPVKSAGKKRPAAASKTPEAKKVKVVTPQKTDGRKSVGGHIATPHPAKNAKSPKSGGQVSCGPCKKNFNSQSALDSHSKAKHSGK